MKPMFWVDLEMTGLDENVHHILEVAVVVTDTELNVQEEFHRVVFQPPEVLKLMDDWCVKTHSASGLVAAIPGGVPLAQVETELLALVAKYWSSNDRVVLVGNSVGNDKRFLDRYLPKLARRLHYRIVDVSSLKEIFKDRWGIKFKKGNTHRAVDDIHESIRELRTYLSFVQVPDEAKGKELAGPWGQAEVKP
ncbi:MAG: oligoribonuclease [Bdellovibrionales bacterium]|nr:oligoribonuclease [Bdellovibrionales bacterium]